MDNPLVSIVIPVYNSEEYISGCIRSVLSQNYDNIEVIIVDDGSSDRSADLCRRAVGSRSGVSIYTKSNGGVSSARNFGIKYASGDLITFVDADDHIDENHISDLVNDILSNNSDCSICGYFNEYPNHVTERLFADLGVMPVNTAVMYLLSPCLYQGFLCNKLFRRRIIQDNSLALKEDIHYYEDLLFCSEYFKHCNRISCTSSATYHYCQHAGSAINGTVFSDERICRIMAGINAIRSCGGLYKDTPEIADMFLAREKTEYARLFRQAYVGHADAALLSELKKRMSSEKRVVLRSDVGIKEKIRYITTCFFPKTASGLWTGRERRYLE